MIPVGSTWRRNPIPPCKESTSGGAYNVTCPGPTFPPPIEWASGRNLSWAWGYGPGSVVHNENATREDILKVAFNFGIVDQVVVPDVPPGDYVLQFRWDCESFSQVWESCADVTIVSDGANTEPFSLTNGCHVCCPQTKSFCSNCTGCLNDKTGDCAYCWTPFPDFEAPDETPLLQCLGYEAEDGGAPEWNWGDQWPRQRNWSPGCAKCWADETACQPHFRPAQPTPAPTPGPGPAPAPSPTSSAICAANPGCVAVGLTGNNNCCPTDDGMRLACCDQTSANPEFVRMV